MVPRNACLACVPMPTCLQNPPSHVLSEVHTQDLAHPHACTHHYTPTQTCDPPNHSLSPCPGSSYADPGATNGVAPVPR